MANFDQAVPPSDSSVDSGVAWHYGDPFAEQRALDQDGGVVDLSHLGVVIVSGSDRLSWLNDLTSQLLTELQPGDSSLALILDPKGHVEYEIRLVDDGVSCWLIVEPAQAHEIASYLDSMRFMRDVEVKEATEQLAALWVSGTAKDDSSLLSHAVVTWQPPGEFTGESVSDAGSDRGGDASKYVPQRPGQLNGSIIIVARDSLQALLEGRDDLAGTWAFEAIRVAAGVPRPILDGDHRALPHELGLIGPAVHLAKGCYRGQETVARVHNMGKPPRRLVLLHLDGSASELPESKYEVIWNDRVVGQVGSVSQHYELGPVALAVVKRNIPVEDSLTVRAPIVDGEEPGQGVSANQQTIVVA